MSRLKLSVSSQHLCISDFSIFFPGSAERKVGIFCLLETFTSTARRNSRDRRSSGSSQSRRQGPQHRTPGRKLRQIVITLCQLPTGLLGFFAVSLETVEISVSRIVTITA